MAMFILPKHSTAKTLLKKRFCIKMIKPNKRHSPKCCKTPGVPFSAPPDLITNVGVPQGWQKIFVKLWDDLLQNASCFTLRFGTHTPLVARPVEAWMTFVRMGVGDGEVSKNGEPLPNCFPESWCMFRKKPIHLLHLYRGLCFDCFKKKFREILHVKWAG